jgi:hypothetical protein
MKSAPVGIVGSILLLLVAGCGSNGPQRVVMTEGSVAIAANTCVRFTFELQKSDGTPANAPEPNGYTMLAFSPRRFPDATCNGSGEAGTNLTFPPGSSSVTFYIKENAGSLTYATEALLEDPNNLFSFYQIERFEFSLNVAR